MNIYIMMTYYDLINFIYNLDEEVCWVDTTEIPIVIIGKNNRKKYIDSIEVYRENFASRDYIYYELTKLKESLSNSAESEVFSCFMLKYKANYEEHGLMDISYFEVNTIDHIINMLIGKCQEFILIPDILIESTSLVVPKQLSYEGLRFVYEKHTQTFTIIPPIKVKKDGKTHSAFTNYSHKNNRRGEIVYSRTRNKVAVTERLPGDCSSS